MSDVIQTESHHNIRGTIVGLTLGSAALIWSATAFIGQNFVPGSVPGTLGDMAWLFPVVVLAIALFGTWVFRKYDATGLGLTLTALIISFFSVGWFAIAALGSKWGLWHWSFGLNTMTVGLGQYVVFGATGLSISALLIGLLTPSRVKPTILGIGALLVSILLAGRLVGLGAGAGAVPQIHDIQTDWAEPVELSEEMMAARGSDSNKVRYGEDARFEELDKPSLEDFKTEEEFKYELGFFEKHSGKLIAKIQEEAECISDDEDVCEDSETPKPYRPIRPLIINQSSAEVFEMAADLVEQRGWDVVTSDAATGRIEATYTSPWWGFKDDVAIRITAEADDTRVDMRSISRVGQSDLGANARRVTYFLYDLDGQRWQ